MTESPQNSAAQTSKPTNPTNHGDFEKYDGLIFDCDGTLTDSMPIHYVAWRDTLHKHGIEFPENRFYQMAGMPSDKVIDTTSFGVWFEIRLTLPS